MSNYQISIVNEDFSSCSDHEMPSLDAAAVQALTAALRIGSDEIIGGKKLFGAEVKVEADKELCRRFVVSISASALSIEPATRRLEG